MAVLTQEFRNHTQTNHHEHEQLMQELGKLAGALEAVVCHFEVYTDLGPAQQVGKYGRELSRWLPEHFRHEEQQVLAPLAQMSPELQMFVRQMVREHRDLSERLRAFCLTVEQLEDTPDLAETIQEMKRLGSEFAERLASHMGAEENKLARVAR